MVERARALERSIVRVRWFAVAFGAFQVLSYRFLPDPLEGPRTAPGFVRPAGLAVVVALALLNVAVTAALRRPKANLHRLSIAAFAGDVSLVFALTWIFSFDRNATIWVILYVLGVEGAVRFQLAGALWPAAAAFPLEIARDLYREHAFGYAFGLSGVTYRVGIMAIIAAVAGIMGRNLERERVQAEALAARERAALDELEAFHEVVLAGIEGADFGETVDRVVSVMASALGYEAFGIGLVEEGPGGPVVRCVGACGHPVSSTGRAERLDEGICGEVARTGEPRIVADALVEPTYVEWVPGVRSEMCAPVKDGDRVIGVIDVESREVGRFSTEDLQRLVRLSPQVGLVLMNARLLEQERAAVARLRELDTMKSDFVAITSHELRTPLTSIRGFVKTLRREEAGGDPAQSHQYLAIIDRQTERLSRLVEDLLIVSRIEAGGLQLEKEPVDVARLLSEVVEDVGVGMERVRLAIDEPIPRVLTDGQRLAQVMRNLVENAIKFSPDSVRISAQLHGEALVLQVGDRGPGIPREDLGRIFDRFYQVGGSMGRRAQGAGLGLYIARELVRALGGTIAVASELGSGTTFTVTLPTRAVGERAQDSSR